MPVFLGALERNGQGGLFWFCRNSSDLRVIALPFVSFRCPTLRTQQAIGKHIPLLPIASDLCANFPRLELPMRPG